jgi:hypothetical protein
MQSHIASPWNHAIAFLQLAYREHTFASASGFFWSDSGRTFLVTNWHNFSGKNPSTDQPIDKMARLPDRVVFTVMARSTELSDGFYEVKAVPLVAELGGVDQPDSTWFEHPSLGRNVDIAALDVTDILAGQRIIVSYANELESDAALDPFVSQDVFIVGYPIGLVANVPIPVWKRGTIATEPLFDPDDQPKVYVDAATRQGMSGSIVLARHLRFGPYKKRDGAIVNMFYAQLDLVLGVYSGRLHAHNVEAQLGVVWKRHLIHDTVRGGARPKW